MLLADAKWIWLKDASREKNVYAAFARLFEVKARPKRAVVHITSDSRYELRVNGTWVGHGPVRSWPSPWPVDSYDVRHLLRAGENEIDVLVTHFGISTFQYIHDEPGLIAQIELDDQRIVTDASWQAAAHESFLWPAPRITCQQAWEEQYDARREPSAARGCGTWATAKVLRKAGQGAHAKFEPRDIPMLTCESVEPASIVAIDVVRPADYTFALNPREFVNAKDKSANHILARMLVMTTIDSPAEQKIDLHEPHTRPRCPWKLNGKRLEFSDHSLHKTDTGVAHATLRKGLNTLMARLPESEHHFWANINIRTQQPVKFSPWLAAGPFAGSPTRHGFDEHFILPERIDPAATAERFEEIWKAGALDEEQRSAAFVRAMTRDMVASEDAYATCVSDRPETSVEARVDDANAMLFDNADWTTIHPAHDGASVRILFDYGRELIGFQEFEIDAPAGTVVDVCNFEFIQRDGRFNLNESMNNSFRYICREGVQRYRTFLRRGLKYSWMTLRNFNSPVRVRFVRVLMSTYPQTGAGSFECSDAKLTQIWRTGVHTVRCCSEDTYTDCPTYEQTLWVGDARNEALVDLVANGDARLSARCLRLTGRSLDRSPIAESQVPSGWQNLLPTWTFLWMRWAQEHYQLTGDREFARELLGYLERNIAGMKRAINDRGLFEMYAWNLFDWAAMDTPADGIVTHISCLASLGLRQCAQLARDLGDEAHEKDWDAAAGGLADAVNRHLWSSEKRAYLDCIRSDGSPSPTFSQQTQTAAYISGVATGERAERCRALMQNPPADFVKAGSPFFMFFLLEALAHEKDFDALTKTIRDYWGKQIDAGATTFWEMYQEPAARRAFSGSRHRLTRSHCHGWSAAPTFFLTQYILGVRPGRAGYAEVLVAPQPGELTWTHGRVPTPAGVVECYWRNESGRFDLRVTTPRNHPLRIELPWRGKVDISEGSGEIDGNIVKSTAPKLTLSVQ